MAQITPSPLNHIHLFKQDEQVWWLNNQYVTQRDRANYYMVWRVRTSAFIYVETTVQPDLSILDCLTFVTIAGYGAVNLGGNLWRFHLPHSEGTLNSKRYIMINSSGAFTSLYPLAVATFFLPVNSAGFQGFQVKFDRSFVIKQFVVKMDIPIALVNQVTVSVYRVNPDNVEEAQLISSFGYLIPFVGVNDVTIIPPAAVLRQPWSKGDILRVILTPQGADTFNIYYDQFDGLVANVPYVQKIGGAIVVDYTAEVVARVLGRDAVYSELYIDAVNDVDNQATIKFKNKRPWLGILANTEMLYLLKYALRKHVYPQEYEDIEIAPGEFTRLRNEQKIQLEIETNFMPDYAHEKIKLIMSHDEFKINGIEYIQQEPYTFDPAKHTALSKGQVTLTERKSILKNVI